MKLALIGLVLLAGCAKPHQLSNVNDGMTDATTVYGHCPGPDCYNTTDWSNRATISGDCRPGVPGGPLNCKYESPDQTTATKTNGYYYDSQPEPGPLQGQWMAEEPKPDCTPYVPTAATIGRGGCNGYVTPDPPLTEPAERTKGTK